MRIASVILGILLVLPVADAAHTPPARSKMESIEKGAAILLVLEATGVVNGMGAGEERHPRQLQTWTHSSSWTYSWGGTVELRRDAEGVLTGPAELTGGGRGRQSDVSHTVHYHEGGSTENYLITECNMSAEAAGPAGAESLVARGNVSADGRMLLVYVSGLSGPYEGEPDCVTTSVPQTSTPHKYRHAPPIPLSPLVSEGVELLSSRRAQIEQVAPGLDELHTALGLLFEVPLDAEISTLHGETSGSFPIHFDSPVTYVCFSAIGFYISGTCTATGLLKVRVLVDPCPMLRESRAVHAAAVNALKQPAPGSSESQVRAFQVDAGQKVRAFLSDERAVQLICGAEDDQAVANAARVAQMIVDAWADVAKTHGLSDDGKRDLLSAARQSQLLGGSDDGSATNALLGQVFSSPGNGAISIKVHSPVALHAWDEAGRHVGWNATTNAADVQIEGANYTGEPGGAQDLSLPAGFYKVATVELGPGRYALNSAWNGTAGDGAELLPLTSEAGRTVVMNVLMDHLGYVAGPAQRIATENDASFAFVEPWRPLMTRASGDATPPPTGSGATQPTGATDASPTAAVDEGGGDEKGSGTPAPGALLVLALLLAIAVARRRGP